jgi:hypothetical protein
MHNGSKKRRTPRKVPVGTKVILPIGALRYRGTVIEDLGNIGARGRRLVAVRVAPAFEGDEPRILDWPWEELSVRKK